MSLALCCSGVHLERVRIHKPHEPQIRLIEPALPAELVTPAHIRAAYEKGLAIGKEGGEGWWFFESRSEDFACERGVQHGLQIWAAQWGKTYGREGREFRYPIFIPGEFEAEYKAGWERGNREWREHMADAAAAAEVWEGAERIWGAAYQVTDRDMYPYGGVS